MDAPDGFAGEHAVRGTGAHAAGAAVHQHLGGLAEGAGGVDHVVHDDDVLALDLADGGNGTDHVGPLAGLVADDHRAHQFAGIDVGALGAAHVGRGDGEVLEFPVADVGDEDLAGVHVVHRDVEETLDLAGVKVAGHHAVGPGGPQQVRDELGADGHARTVLAVLAGPAEVGDDGGNLIGGGALGGVDGEQQFHEVVCRRDGGLDDVDGGAADALRILGLEFAVAEGRGLQGAQVQLGLLGRLDGVDVVDDLAGEVLGGPAGEQFQTVGMYHDVILGLNRLE